MLARQVRVALRVLDRQAHGTLSEVRARGELRSPPMRAGFGSTKAMEPTRHRSPRVGLAERSVGLGVQAAQRLPADQVIQAAGQVAREAGTALEAAMWHPEAERPAS